MHVRRNNRRRRGAESPFWSSEQREIQAVKLGRQNERAVVNALNTRWEAPLWFLGCHISSKKQDRDGIDVVIQTMDVGELLLQVKSSDCGRRWFLLEERERGLDRPIAVVIVREGRDTKDDIRRKVLRELHPLRNRCIRLARESIPVAI
ncbi:hypothetical protein A3E39_03865 [Candidatus Uhrbacteria bacterium RIFCSPHIGHO2_12_FULL_60_25]|uniref:DUF4365 domain-containing protein n=1 Tax=Candidatus Uhrbacteria bacterium RIFCSPHIGHO2_12_FULL_60_25 TaxID=1802399 RepID=A0A1F7UKL1_9BACT|nr:MAG: hypothetical protein A3D73_02000 [Candidatus Uhrbacteria bacterium RIFCSPHIGHO2_02_FULL_60_44]OGL78274.1 MAG: hypothetical protein A3E39_03865 [Candidatus Uhrbacteria bacterium RIFCSPHIGHO2_12_FULL_60_25]